MVNQYSLRRNPITGGHYMAPDDATSGKPLYVRDEDYATIADSAAQSESLISRLRDILGAHGGSPENTLVARAHYLAERCERLEAEVSGLRAARIAYASEFPLNADGEPDVGSIHANIRAMKLDAMRYGWAVQSPQFLMWMNANNKKQADTYIDGSIASLSGSSGGKDG